MRTETDLYAQVGNNHIYERSCRQYDFCTVKLHRPSYKLMLSPSAKHYKTMLESHPHENNTRINQEKAYASHAILHWLSRRSAPSLPIVHRIHKSHIQPVKSLSSQKIQFMNYCGFYVPLLQQGAKKRLRLAIEMYMLHALSKNKPMRTSCLSLNLSRRNFKHESGRLQRGE